MRRCLGAAGALAGALCALCLLSALCAGCAAPVGPGAPEQAIRVTPADGARDVRVGAPLRVSVARGRLVRVRVVRKGDTRHRALPGRFSRTGRTWRAARTAGHSVARGARKLVPGSAYAVDVLALDVRGRRTARHVTFTTREPARRFLGFFTPEHRQTVGTGMIPSIRFSTPIDAARRAAVERAIRVTARPRVPVAPHWFGGSRLDFRPRRYWSPGTRVTLDLRLRGVQGAPGRYGVQRKRVHFTVGRNQRSVVDAARHTMTVLRDGRAVARVPITAGSAENPTYNGRMVITEKHDVTHMDGSTVGFGGEYDIDDVPHAMRLTDSGTFLHGNYWAGPGTFGSANVSHGCVGLRDVRGGSRASPAGAFFSGSLVGDVVTVTGSDERTVAPDNGLGGWNLPWGARRAGRPLSRTPPHEPSRRRRRRPPFSLRS